MLDLSNIESRLTQSSIEDKYNRLVSGLKNLIKEYEEENTWDDTAENIDYLLTSVGELPNAR